MPLDPVPWFIEGGAVHSAATARQVLYSAMGGKQGIITPGDFKVTAQSTPAGSVLVAAGAASINNTYPGANAEAYGVRGTAETVPVPPADGGARSDLLVLRIDDPEFGGSNPPDVASGPYDRFQLITGVPAGTTAPNVSYPCIPLARIDQPSGSQVVTSAMITDLRYLARPRAERLLRVRPMGGGDGRQTLTSTASGGQAWPPQANWDIEIPPWANRARIIASWNTVVSPAGNSEGTVWVRFGPVDVEPQLFNFPDTGEYKTMNVVAAADGPIGAQYRGTRQNFAMRGRLEGAWPDNSARPYLDYFSSVVLDVEFYETVV